MAVAKVLVVDDDEAMRFTLVKLLEKKDFDVTSAASVPEALKLIAAESFEVLLSDLHMPGAGDGLTVVSAMKHFNPHAVTLLLSGFPQMDAASEAILLQADEVLVKPLSASALIEVILQRLAKGPRHRRVIESVRSILQRTAQEIIEEWLTVVHGNTSVMKVALSDAQRSAHLAQLFRDLEDRLHADHPLGTTELPSSFAAAHGKLRREQGYTAAMLVEESRILQVSIFHTLQKNIASIDFSLLLNSVMTIADEVDSQLSQAMSSYVGEPASEALPA